MFLGLWSLHLGSGRGVTWSRLASHTGQTDSVSVWPREVPGPGVTPDSLNTPERVWSARNIPHHQSLQAYSWASQVGHHHSLLIRWKLE